VLITHEIFVVAFLFYEYVNEYDMYISCRRVCVYASIINLVFAPDSH